MKIFKTAFFIITIVLISCPLAMAQTGNDGGTTTVGNPQNTLALTQFITIDNICGDYVAAGVGLRGQTSGNITISGIPGGATVRNAFLYSGFLDNGESPSLKSLTFNGTPVTGTQVGSGGDTCWGRSNSFAYRTDVTALVTGDGVYSLTGVASGGAILAQGASLVVVYNDATAAARTIVINEGDDVLNFVGANFTNTLTGFTATAPVTAKTTFIVGDGQAFTETVSFTGGNGTLNLNNSFTGSDGLYWDTITPDVSAQVAVGDVSVSANINLGGNDCLMWVAQVFSVTAAPDTKKPFCEITAFNPGPPVTLQITTGDLGSGLCQINVVQATNATVVIPPFTPGTNSFVVVTATKNNPNFNSIVELQVVDCCGNVTFCDPVFTTLSSTVPQDFALKANYPNPFNPATTIHFDIPSGQAGGVQVLLKIYDILGREVQTLVEDVLQPGEYSVPWDGTNNSGEAVTSGVYIYRIVAGDFTATRKMTFMK